VGSLRRSGIARRGHLCDPTRSLPAGSVGSLAKLFACGAVIVANDGRDRTLDARHARAIGGTATVATHLARDARWRASQTGGDAAQRAAAQQRAADLLALERCQVTRRAVPRPRPQPPGPTQQRAHSLARAADGRRHVDIPLSGRHQAPDLILLRLAEPLIPMPTSHSSASRSTSPHGLLNRQMMHSLLEATGRFGE